MTRSFCLLWWMALVALSLNGCGSSSGDADSDGEGSSAQVADGSAMDDAAPEPSVDVSEDGASDAVDDSVASASEVAETPEPDATPEDVAGPPAVDVVAADAVATAEDVGVAEDVAAPDAEEEGGTACLTEQDELVFDEVAATETSDFYQTMSDCAFGCFAVKVCMSECLSDALGFTLGCATCVAEVLLCASGACLQECSDGGPACDPCMLEAGCWDLFEPCAGVPW